LYEINSLIELNDWGGIVDINNSEFTGFSSCGSIIRNFYKYLDKNYYDKAWHSISTSIFSEYNYRNW
jgi:hypothetical protein